MIHAVLAGFLASACFAQDSLPTPGQPTPWLDMNTVSSAPVQLSSGTEAAAEAPKGPPPLELDWALLQTDLKLLEHYRDGLSAVVQDMKRGLERDAWLTALDYAMALDLMEQYYGKFSMQAPVSEKDKTVRYAGSYLAYYTALMAQTRWALDWSEHYLTEKERNRPWLEEPQPDLGLPGDAFTRLQQHLSLMRKESTLRLAAMKYVRLHESKGREWFWQKKEIEPLDTVLLHEARRVAGAGSPLTAEEEDWLPASSWIAQWLDTQVTRDDLQWVIAEPAHPAAPEQVLNLNDELMPGDIILVRRTPFRGDVGVGGFWNDAAIFIGTPEERKRYFGNDTMEAQLKNRYPKAYGLVTSSDKPAIRVFQASWDGVGFSSLERLLEQESAAALRPKLSKIAVAEAILRLFQYAGRPYDDRFNADSEEAFNGAKLALKAYEGRANRSGLDFSLTSMFGRRIISANDIAKKFDSEFGLQGDAQQLDFVWYVENARGAKKPSKLTLEEFRSSWRRPKWPFAAMKSDENQSERP